MVLLLLVILLQLVDLRGLR
jgi:hypothetical protein